MSVHFLLNKEGTFGELQNCDGKWGAYRIKGDRRRTGKSDVRARTMTRPKITKVSAKWNS